MAIARRVHFGVLDRVLRQAFGIASGVGVRSWAGSRFFGHRGVRGGACHDQADDSPNTWGIQPGYTVAMGERRIVHRWYLDLLPRQENRSDAWSLCAKTIGMYGTRASFSPPDSVLIGVCLCMMLM